MSHVLFFHAAARVYLSSNGNLDLNTGLDVDDDLLDDLGGGVEAGGSMSANGFTGQKDGGMLTR